MVKEGTSKIDAIPTLIIGQAINKHNEDLDDIMIFDKSLVWQFQFGN